MSQRCPEQRRPKTKLQKNLLILPDKNTIEVENLVTLFDFLKDETRRTNFFWILNQHFFEELKTNKWGFNAVLQHCSTLLKIELMTICIAKLYVTKISTFSVYFTKLYVT